MRLPWYPAPKTCPARHNPLFKYKIRFRDCPEDARQGSFLRESITLSVFEEAPMRISHRLTQGFFALLLSALIIPGAHPSIAAPLSLSEAQEQSLFEVSGGKTAEEQNTVESTGASAMLGRLQKRIVQTWNEGNLDLIVTAYAWHNRLTYDKERVRRYNENAWGGGLGLSMFDEDGDTHMLFLTAFNDSWNKVQPYGGYGFLKNWHFGPNNDFRAGVGISLGITARHEYDYIPLPLPLPMFGVGYKRFSVEAAYVPGTRNNGNVLFTWIRWTFD
jgi:palmitoyl transferase